MGAKTFLGSKKIKKEDNFFDMKKMGGVDFFYFKTSMDENTNYKKKNSDSKSHCSRQMQHAPFC